MSREGAVYLENKKKKEREQIQAREERDAAKRASLQCAHCHGEGMVTVYHPRWTGEPVEQTCDGIRYPTVMAAHCCCELGRWTRARNSLESQRLIPYVEDILAGRMKWLLEPPTLQPFFVNEQDAPPCQSCRKPMCGGYGGLPWICLRGDCRLGKDGMRGGQQN